MNGELPGDLMALEPTPALVLDVARTVTGRMAATLQHWTVTPVGTAENITTHSLCRLSGTLSDGTDWSVFAKTLHPAWDSPIWPLIPEERHAEVLVDLNWLDEPRVYASALRADLPDGLRMPDLYRVDQTASRITLWLEDVEDHQDWSLERYRQTAVVLGGLAGLWPEPRASAELGMARRSLASLFYGKITAFDLVRLADEAFWGDPVVAAVVDGTYRADLGRLAAATPSLLRRLDALPYGLAHGDAAPDNLRQRGDGRVTAIDWSYGSCGALGSDLGQLLAGRFESGHAEADSVHEVAAAILDGYADGLAQQGCSVDARLVEEGWATHLAIRSVFSALILDHRPGLDENERSALLTRRAALGRFGLDLAARVLDRNAG